MNSPEKFCASFTTVARLIGPLHSTSNDTVAGTGAIGGIDIVDNPCPFVKLFARSWKSGIAKFLMCSDARASSNSTSKLSGSIRTVQNNPFEAIGGE